MATRRKKKPARSGGSWLVLMFGMVLGVGAAVAVALFVTQAPMPFKDKASRTAPGTLLPDAADAPDPNIALYGKDGPAGTRSAAQGGSALAPPAGAGERENPLSDAIGQIISNLDRPEPPATAPAPAPTPSAPAAAGSDTGTGAAPAAGGPLAAVPPPLPTPPAAKPAPGTQTTYYLQTGAFRSESEAQAMLARVVLLGLPVRIEVGESGGAPINRVRVGPFKGIDEMNRARTRLGDEKIESSVVRP